VGQLEITFRIGLAHHLLALAVPSAPIVASFPETGNTVYIDPPDRRAVTEEQAKMGAFARFTLRVRRECTDQQGRDAGITELHDLHVFSDAGKAFWQFFETVRESDFREDGSLVGYPVARADEIQNNPLVRTCHLECSYDGMPGRTIPLTSHPAIQISENAWKEAERRLSSHEEVPPQVSFALDAGYFAESDPIRAIIMACAAWETALRSYLANIASKRDPAYLVASLGGNIPRLYAFMKAAKGGHLFHDRYGQGVDAHLDRQRDCIDQLPKLRNKLLHEGRTAIPEGAALDAALAVLNAIDWLFEGTASP
jgi:hypothetical protein